jgi:PadR family transcriptional regulator, regulatory protein AphA
MSNSTEYSLRYLISRQVNYYSRKDSGEVRWGKMKTLDYVILAGLIRKPRSGYDLTKWMERETSHYFAIGHSSIYPALARMEREGLVRYEVVPSDQGPERKVYSLTEAGCEALLSWVEEPPAKRQVRDEQLVKALCYGFLPKERALGRLREEKARHEEKLALYEEFERELEEELREGRISREAYLGTLLTLRRGIGAESSYVEWCEEAARMISSLEQHPADGSRTS